MTAVDPHVDSQRLELQLPDVPNQDELTIHLSSSNVIGEDAIVVWRNAAIQKPGSQPISLCDISGAKQALDQFDHLVHNNEYYYE